MTIQEEVAFLLNQLGFEEAAMKLPRWTDWRQARHAWLRYLDDGSFESLPIWEVRE